jgi:metallo-beta-lactamase family protein
MSLTLQFLGANATVTGSRTLVETDDARLLVDCGLFQGYKPLRLRNWAPFPLDPASLDAVVLTHAHLDHSGYLPRLVRLGFDGPIWCTPATAALCRILLPDSARLLEEEAGYANRKSSSRHRPAEPLYDERDATRALKQLVEVDVHHDFAPAGGVRARFRRQGHILGAAAVTLEHAQQRIVFSGDVGRPNDPVMRAPEPPDDADWLVVEATYGNRKHRSADVEAELADALRPVLERGGVAVVPAFAVGRAQALLHAIARLQSAGRIPEAPVYLNSPMASDVTALYRRFPDDHRLDAAALAELSRNTRIINSVEESKALNRRKGPMVIVSASGMATGGRVLHHLRLYAPDSRNTIALVGFQASGTRGAALAAHENSIKLHGEYVRVRANVESIASLSAHADYRELLQWLSSLTDPPVRTFVTHGEPAAADAMRRRISETLGWPCEVPVYQQTVELEGL